jgi:protease IV
MKQFLKFTLASMLGVFITLLLAFLILLGVVGAISSSDSKVTIEENSILKIDLNGTFSEQSVDNPFNFSIPGVPMDTQVHSQGLDDILEAILKAKTNPKIKGIYLETGVIVTGFATSDEIRNALIDFKKSGKFVLAYGEVMDQKEYYICTVADQIVLNPEGMINFNGLAATPVFYKETLDKLGVKAEVFRVGTFKSAVEPFIATKMSDASRLQTQENLDGLWSHVLDGISASRKVSKEELTTLANRNMLFEAATELVKCKLADSILYKTDMMKYLSVKAGVEGVDNLKLISVSDFIDAAEETSEFEREKVAVLYADGDIYDSGNDGIVSDDLIKEILKIEKDSMIKAVVLRVNSPGGSAYAAEQIWKAVSELKAKKPVVVSMGDYAASGGYYISCCADKIVASPNTITGSIGIFGMYFILDEMTKKIGLNYDVVKTNDLSDLGNMTRPMTAIERQKIQNHVNRGYDLFVKRCSDGRKMKEADLRKIAEGRVYTGKNALELGLVDEIGGIDKAIGIAAKLGKVKKYRMVYFPEKKNFLTLFMEEFAGDTKMRIVQSFLGEEYTPLLKLKTSKIQTGILTKMNPLEIN